MSLETAGVPNRSLFQSLAYSDPISHFVGGVDFMTPINDLQSVRDKADLASGFVKPVDSLDPDIKKRNEIQDWYKNKVEEISTYAPHEQLRAAKRLGQTYAEELKQGELGSIAGNYSNYQAHAKELQDQFDKKLISKDKRDYALKRSLEEYKGIGTPNQFGAYAKYNGRTASKDEDAEVIAEELAKGWKEDALKGVDPNDPKKRAKYRITEDGKYQIYSTKGWEGVSANDIAKYVNPSLKAHNGLKQHINEIADNEAYSRGLRGAEAEDWVNKRKEELYSTAINRVANKYGYNKTEYDEKLNEDAYALMDAKDQIENPNVRFEMKGIGINPGTRETTLKDVYDNIEKLSTHTSNLQKYLKDNPNLSEQEKDNATSQIALNNAMVRRKQSMLETADKELIKNILSPNERLLYNEWVQNKEDGVPRFLRLGNQDPLKRKIESINLKLEDNTDEWLKQNSENYTLQPNLITIDSSPNKPSISKSIETLYNQGLGSWTVMDENGVINDKDAIPRNLHIKQISKTPVDELGYLFGGVYEEKDDKGNIISTKQYYLKPNGKHNIEEKVGLDLINENRSSTTEQGRDRYLTGLSMVKDPYIYQVSDIAIDETKPVLDPSSHKELGEVSKIKTATGDKYIIDGDTNYPFNNEREVANYFANVSNK